MFFRKQKTKNSNLLDLISKSFWGALAFLLCFGWLVRAEDVVQEDVLIESAEETAREKENKNNKNPLNPSTSASPQIDGPLKKEEDDKENDSQNEKLEDSSSPASKLSLEKEENNKKDGGNGKEEDEEDSEDEDSDLEDEDDNKNEIGDNKKEDEKSKCNLNNRPGLEKVFLNEVFPNPLEDENEWIELFNSGIKEVDLSGCLLVDKNLYSKDKSEQTSYFKEGEKIQPGEYKVIFNKKTNQIERQFVMNNSDEEIYFLDEDKNKLDELFFKEQAEKDFSYSLNQKRVWQWVVGEFVTPGEENRFPEPQTYSKKLEITEFMPNPEGVDKSKEWVELFNGDEEKIQLEGWYLLNQSNKKFDLDQFEINPDEFSKIEIKNSSFSIKNSEGWIELRDPNNEIVDRVGYSESAKMNSSYNKRNNEIWEWSIFVTPGKKNKFNNPPTFKVDIPEDIYKDVKNEFKIKNAKDENGEELKYRWEFSTGKRSYIPITTQTFDKKGSYTVEVRVSDRSIDVFKSFKFRVKNFPELDLEIVKLLPNPEGSDSENEKIWIKNNENKRINLKGWMITTGKDSENLTNHYIKDDFKIKAGEIEDLKREDCAFSLLNKKARIFLKSPDGKVADEVKYEKDKIEEGEIYLKQNGEWVWESPFLSEKENPVQILGSNNTLKEEDRINFFDIFSRLFNKNQRKSERLRIICFKNWLYSKSEKPFFDVVFPGSLKSVI
jgi:hypothetical protein